MPWRHLTVRNCLPALPRSSDRVLLQVASFTHPVLSMLQTFSEDGFYAWTYDRPASPYLLLYSALIVLVVVGCCLFPLAPYRWAQ